MGRAARPPKPPRRPPPSARRPPPEPPEPDSGISARTERAGRVEERLRVRRFRLVGVDGPDAGIARLSEERRVVIGTHESVDILLHDRTVSRFHCEVSVEDEGVLVRDLGSRNGTLVDGVPVIHAPLRHQAVLTLGRSQLRFELSPDSLEIALSEGDRFGAMVARSLTMRAAFALFERAAASDAAVLLEGETGTGKEVAAEAIHRASPRREGPFIVVDCGAIPPHLLESDLFGHERGAFTDAATERVGAFEAAHGGTVFLDEVGELELELQPKLLRVLERKEIKRLGQSRYQPVDVRIIAATNRDLRSLVNAHTFRSDLYYRLAVLTVRLPPLREREGDLPLLVTELLKDLEALDQPGAAQLQTGAFLAHLGRHSWPGNVRELRNYLEQCLVLQQRAPLPTAQTGTVDPSIPFKVARQAWVQSFERRYLEASLRQHGGNIRAAARAAGVDRIYFYRMLWRHGLR